MLNRQDLEIRIRARDQGASSTARHVRHEYETLARSVAGSARSTDLYGRVGRAAVGTSMALAAGIGAATHQAIGFDDSMREVNTMVRTTDLGKLKESLLDVASDPHITAMPRELAAGLYEVGSGGRAAAAGEQAVLRAGAQLAEAGRSDMAPALNALLRIMRPYRVENERAGDVADAMFTVVREGLPHLEQWVGAMGESAGIAARAGVGYDEMLAALVAMSDALSPDEASTALNRLVMSFMSPKSKDFARTLKEIGFDAEAGLDSIGGLANAVRILDEYTGGSEAKLAELGLDLRAFKGLLFLTGGEGSRYNEILAQMAQRQGFVSEALRELEGPGHDWRKALQQATIAGIEFGEELLPIATAAAKAVTALAQGFNALPPGLKKAAAAAAVITTMFTGAVGAETLLRIGAARLKGELMAATVVNERWAGSNIRSTKTVAAETTAIRANSMALRENAAAHGTATAARKASYIPRGLTAGQAGAAEAYGFGLAGRAAQRVRPSGALVSGGARAFWAGQGIRHVGGVPIAAGSAGGSAASGMLARMAPSVAAALPILLHPTVVAAAASAGVFWYFHKEMVQKALQDMESRSQQEVAMAGRAQARGIVTERAGTRLDPEKAEAFRPHGARWWTLGMGASDWRLRMRMEKMSSEERTKTLERIKKQRGEEAFHWFAMRMPDVTRRRLSIKEQVAESRGERVRSFKEEQRAGELQEAIRRDETNWREMPAAPGGYGQTVNLQLNVNDRKHIGREVQRAVDEREREWTAGV